MGDQGPLQRAADIPLLGIFGALVAFSYLVPVSIIVGGAGVFNLGWVMQTLTGVLLGPLVGGEAVIIGAIVGSLASPSLFGPLGFVLPVLAAIQAGLIVWGHWRLASLVLISLIFAWFALPTGFYAWPMTLFHVLGIVIIAALGRRLPLMIRESTTYRRVFIGWTLTAYCADVTRHMLGSIFAVLILSFPPSTFLLALPYTFVEQIMFALASAAIGVSTLFAIRSAKLDIPLTRLGRHEQVVEEE